MKNILILLAGGRPNGNTAQLSRAFQEGARQAGHQVKTVSLLQYEVRPCLGCNACGNGRPCVQRDDFARLVPDILRADLLVFASPLYYWTLSARFKALVERFYSLSRTDPVPPLGRYEKYPEKDCALLMTAADNYFWTFEQAERYYRFALVNYIGFHDRGTLLAGGCGDSRGGPAIGETGWLEKAYLFGKTVYPAQGCGPEEEAEI